MVYQDNNNRVVPKSTEYRTIKPAASPADKMIKYAVDNSSASKWQNIGVALQALGKGVMSYDVLLHYEANENALKAAWKTAAEGGNKKEWAEVSKRIGGMAKFNPYNDDAYRNIQSQEIAKQALIEILTTPELDKMSPDAFSQLVNDKNQQMFESFKETKLSPKDYGNAVVQWNKSVGDLSKKYVTANKEHLYKQLQIKQSDDMCQNIAADLMEAEKFEPLGQYGKGNIDLYNRPQVKLKDGSTATVYSSSYNIDGQEVLLPLVSDDGRIMTDDEAVEQYKKTGKYLGKFDTVEEANKYAGQLHISQDMYYNGKSSKSIILRNTINSKIEELNELGMPADTQAEVILTGLRNYVARNLNQLDDSEVLAAITDLKVGDGTPLRELVPNYDIKMKDLLMQAREANLRQMELEVKAQEFKEEQRIKECMTDFLDKYTSGQLKDPLECQKYVKELVDKNGLNGINQIKLFNDIKMGRKTWQDLAEIESDPSVKANLALGVISGTTTYSDITKAIENNTLNPEDGYRMLQNMQVREQKQYSADSKKVQKHLKEAEKEFTKDDITKLEFAVLRDPDQQTQFKNDLTELVSMFENDKDYTKFNNRLWSLKEAYRQAQEEAKKGKQDKPLITGFAKGFKYLSSTPQIPDSQWQRAKIDLDSSKAAIAKMGIIRNNNKKADKSIGIVSAPQKSRTVTVTQNGKSFTKTARHTGYDLKGNYVKNGRAVYPPIGVNEGVVVAVQLENQSGGMGNTVSVYIPEHGVMKVMHLQRAKLPSVGDKVTQDTPIGYVGNSGAVEKAPQNLHIEFTNEKHEWVTASQFLGMGFKTQKIRDRK